MKRSTDNEPDAQATVTRADYRLTHTHRLHKSRTQPGKRLTQSKVVESAETMDSKSGVHVDELLVGKDNDHAICRRDRDTITALCPCYLWYPSPA